LAHATNLGKAVRQAQRFFEAGFVLGQSVIVALVKSAHHALFFCTLEAGNPFLPFCWSKEGFAVELDDAPLAKTRFDVGFGFTAFVAAFQEFADEVAQDFAVAVGTDPDFLEMSEGKQGAKGSHVVFIALVGIGADEFIEARFANDELLDVGAQELGGPAGKRRGFQGETHTGASQKSDLGDKIFSGGGEADGFGVGSIGREGGEHGCGAVEVQGGEECGMCIHSKKSIVSTWRNCHAMIFPEIKHDSPNGYPRRASC
jgi:hypothetical protein